MVQRSIELEKKQNAHISTDKVFITLNSLRNNAIAPLIRRGLTGSTTYCSSHLKQEKKLDKLLFVSLLLTGITLWKEVVYFRRVWSRKVELSVLNVQTVFNHKEDIV